MNKELRKMLKALRDAGFEPVETKKGHWGFSTRTETGSPRSPERSATAALD